MCCYCFESGNSGVSDLTHHTMPSFSTCWGPVHTCIHVTGHCKPPQKRLGWSWGTQATAGGNWERVAKLQHSTHPSLLGGGGGLQAISHHLSRGLWMRVLPHVNSMTL